MYLKEKTAPIQRASRGFGGHQREREGEREIEKWSGPKGFEHNGVPESDVEPTQRASRIGWLNGVCAPILGDIRLGWLV